MTWIMVDVKTDGPIPGDYSMVAIGAVVVEPQLDRTFYARLRPVSDAWVPEALAVSGFSREATLTFNSPAPVMKRFEHWILTATPLGSAPRFVSDNNGFDWMFVCWYFWHFLGRNPFGHSSTNLGSLYQGLQKNALASFKHLRKTAHDHNPVNDAKGNAEAMLYMERRLGLKTHSKSEPEGEHR